MKNVSLWKDSYVATLCPCLENNIEVDVLIVGGGITGISCGYHLMDSGLSIAIVDANDVGGGITSRTMGKLTYLQSDIYSKIKKSVGFEQAKLYYESQKDAISIVNDIVNKNNIDCDLEESLSYTFTNDNNMVSVLSDEYELLKKLGVELELDKCEQLPNNIPCKYVIKASGNYVFHPLKYLEGLKKILLNNGISIYENTRILSIDIHDDYYICKTKNLFIKAKKVVLALHYPYFLKPFFMPFKVYLEKSYIGASLDKSKVNFNAISLDKPVKSIRYQNNGKNKYQLLLYGSRNICMNTCEKEHFSRLKLLPFDYEYLWSNIDVITSDCLPYVGEIKNNLFLATGYNTWGMTNGSLAGKIISDLVLDRENRYQELFNPLRGINISKIPLILGSNIKSFVGEIMFHKKDWYDDIIKFEKRNGKEVAIYTDADGVEHIVYTRCPHIGCGLVFNDVELTWDCPCHGSRFNIDGKCIEGPSNYDISYKGE